MEYQYKIEIEMDDEKIIKEGKYVLDSIYDAIRRWFKEEDIQEVKGDSHTLTFIGTNVGKDDFGRMGLVEVSLAEAEWFKPYVKKMLWYNRDYGKDYVENVIEEFRKEGLM